MAKKITEMGYKAAAVVCGKFFNCEDVYTLKEAAEKLGADYDKKWEENDKQLVDTFNGDGFEFLGCVRIKEELVEALEDENVYWEYAYMVKGQDGIYLVVDMWDESCGEGNNRAYRYNVLDKGDFEYANANRAYNKVYKQAK